MVIGTSVLTPTFRYHPSVVAQAFGTLGAMFPGRVVLGVGTGEGLNEVPSTGMHGPNQGTLRPAARGDQLIRKLWTEERVSVRGPVLRTENATIYDKPDKPVPIYVAAAGPQVAKYAGRVGDGFICTSGKAPEAVYRDVAAERRGGAEGWPQAAPDYDRHDRDEGVVRYRPATARCRTRGTGRRWR